MLHQKRTLRPAKEVSVEDFQVSVGIIKSSIFSVSLSGAINGWKYSESINDGELPYVSQLGHQVHYTARIVIHFMMIEQYKASCL